MTPTTTVPPAVSKALTGIEGLDEITLGGLPRGRATLIEGGAGSGKTTLALQCLVNGGRLYREPGIFVAFEESSGRIKANAATFGWELSELEREQLFFLDAQPPFELIQSGTFDLSGMLAGLDAKVEEMQAMRIVFDALDIVLALLPDPAAQRREVYRLHNWLLQRELTALITSKAYEGTGAHAGMPQLGFLHFMVDCAITLGHEVISGISQRSLRVVKYRGSSFSANESPMVIGSDGVEVAGAGTLGRAEIAVTSERISSGVPRLDKMLGGGYFRGASILVTGLPGTAKSTLAGAFAEAACRRGERTLFISFDSDSNEVVRNLGSVGIRLGPHIESGVLELVSARTLHASAEVHLMNLRNMVRAHRSRCMVIDPVSALSKSGNEVTAHGVAERLIDWTKYEGITILCTSLLERVGAPIEATPLQVSTIADTWIHLNYLVHAGERNRSISIVKSRGTSHSNQVRELILSSSGVTLADAYTAGGEVLMGTLRWERERALRAEEEQKAEMLHQRRATLDAETLALERQLQDLTRELTQRKAERDALDRNESEHAASSARGRSELGQMRGAEEP